MPNEEKKLVVITGAGGFLGGQLRRALHRDYRLLSIDISPLPTPLYPGEIYLPCDLGNATAVAKMGEEYAARLAGVAGLIHFAAYYDFSNHPNPRYDRLLLGLRVLLDVFSQRCPPTAPFIFASSMAAMAPTEPGRKLTAQSPKASGWPYPKFKVECEKILDAAKIAQPIVQLVTAGVYSDWCELVPLYHIIDSVWHSPLERTFYPAAVDRGLTYVHLDDLSRAYVSALRQFQGKSGHWRFLVGESKATTFRQIRNSVLMASRGRPSWPLVRLPRFAVWLGSSVLGGFSKAMGKQRFIQPWMVKYAGEHFEFDLTETKAALGWMPTHYLGDELDAMLIRAASNPGEWLARNQARPW